MKQVFEQIFHGGQVFTPNGLERVDIAVQSGRIAAIGTLHPAQADAAIDATGLTILPGVIDTQVHFREPGLEHKEDLASGSRAAALGGVTAFFEMPNTKPATISEAALADKLARAAGRCFVDYAFYLGATQENAHQLGELERLPGCCGVKTFMGSSTGSLLVGDDAGLETVLRAIQRRGAFHAEDEARLQDRMKLAIAGDPSSHPLVRDDEAALLAVQRLVRMARKLGKRVHVLHVSSAKEMAFLAGAKDVASVETTPQFLSFHGPDIYHRLGSLAQMNPPIRMAGDQAALWDLGITQGVVDVLATDHAPHTLAEKAQAYPASPSGMPGVQTLVPVMATHMLNGRLSLARFVDLTSAGPARLFAIQGKGRIALGYDADFTIMDMGQARTIRNADQASRVGWTPFDGWQAKAWPVMTIVRGHLVMREGEMLGSACGAPLRFLECLRN